VITPAMGPGFVEALPVGKFHGIGPATEKKMHALGIQIGADLRAQSLEFLSAQFGKIGPYFYSIARGVDDRPVRADRIRKSISAENTFAQDLFTEAECREALKPLIENVWRYCEYSGVRGRTVVLKVKFSDFHQITRSRSVPGLIGSAAEILNLVNGLLASVLPTERGIRLLGVTLSSLNNEPHNERREEQIGLPL
jgi:DNA polymerase-4